MRPTGDPASPVVAGARGDPSPLPAPHPTPPRHVAAHLQGNEAMTEHNEAQDGAYRLVMPFILCTDQGGPYDAAAFSAGWTVGKIWEKLHAAKGIYARIELYVDPVLVPQLDLVAMHHSYVMGHEPWEEHPDEWTHVWFEPAGSPPWPEDES